MHGPDFDVLRRGFWQAFGIYAFVDHTVYFLNSEVESFDFMKSPQDSIYLPPTVVKVQVNEMDPFIAEKRYGWRFEDTEKTPLVGWAPATSIDGRIHYNWRENVKIELPYRIVQDSTKMFIVKRIKLYFHYAPIMVVMNLVPLYVDTVAIENKTPARVVPDEPFL